MRWKSVIVGFACYLQITLANDLCNGVITGEFITDPESCNHFYYCEDGNNAVKTKCPNGMLFNSQTSLCDLPDNVSCGGATSTSTEAASSVLTTEKQISTTRRPQNSTRPQTTTRPQMTSISHVDSTENPTSNESVKCPEGNSNTVQFVKSSKNCGEYFICYQGTSFKQDCLPELHWNDLTKKCDLPEIVKCRLGNPDGSSSCPSHGESIYPHPTKCDHFIYCIAGFEVPQKCPFYFHFDIVSKTCKLKPFAKCILDNKLD
ncbi:hypothetical protein ACFFRR_010362 [Megaselia abdita]